MTKTPNRRQYLKGIGLGAAALAGLSSPVAADKESQLGDPSGYLGIYASNVDDGNGPNKAEHFGFYPNNESNQPFFPPPPLFPLYHPGNGEGLVGGDEIRITPNQNTLHHYLQFFAGFVMKDDPKPYVLVNKGESPYFDADDQTVEIFESRGQTINFTARKRETIQAIIEDVLDENTAAYLTSPHSPLTTLAGEKWRAVATDRMNVVVDDDKPFAKDAITRVDFYRRGRGRPEYALSLLYVLWGADLGSSIPPDTIEQTEQIITDGRLNLGGQPNRSR